MLLLSRAACPQPTSAFSCSVVGALRQPLGYFSKVQGARSAHMLRPESGRELVSPQSPTTNGGQDLVGRCPNPTWGVALLGAN